MFQHCLQTMAFDMRGGSLGSDESTTVRILGRLQNISSGKTFHFWCARPFSIESTRYGLLQGCKTKYLIQTGQHMHRHWRSESCSVCCHVAHVAGRRC